MHSLNIDNIELRWRWIFGDEHLGFKKVTNIKRSTFIAKLFCVPGEAVKMDGKPFTLSKSLAGMQGNCSRSVTSSTFVVRHAMTLGEIVELPVVKALLDTMTIPSGTGGYNLNAFDRVKVAAVLDEHAATSMWQQLEGMPGNDGSQADLDNDAAPWSAPSTVSDSQIYSLTATTEEDLPPLASQHNSNGVETSPSHSQPARTGTTNAASFGCAIATSADDDAGHALLPATSDTTPCSTISTSWTDPNPTPAKQPKLTAAQALLVCHRDEVQLAILGESYAVQEVLLPVLYREGFSAEEKAIYSPTPLVHEGVERAMVVLDRLTQDSRGELHIAFACLQDAVPKYL